MAVSRSSELLWLFQRRHSSVCHSNVAWPGRRQPVAPQTTSVTPRVAPTILSTPTTLANQMRISQTPSSQTPSSPSSPSTQTYVSDQSALTALPDESVSLLTHQAAARDAPRSGVAAPPSIFLAGVHENCDLSALERLHDTRV